MFDWMVSPEAWLALFTLTALEIVLGIDNIIFLSILVGRLPPAQRKTARTIGLSLAMALRILLLLSLAWVMRLTAPLFSVFDNAISGRDLILLLGGLFLVAKSTHEIHHAMTPEAPHEENTKRQFAGFTGTLVQIAIFDIIFSLDSVITAVGMADHIEVMIIAIILAVGVMMFAAKPIGNFVDAHPTFKVLALSFLILIGVALIADGLDFHIPKGYIYFAIAFSVIVEFINIRTRKHLIEKP